MLRPTQVPARFRISLARTGLSPAPARLSRRFRFPDASARRRPYNPGTRVATPPVWAPPRSLAATGGNRVYFLFLRVLRCFSPPRSPPCSAWMSGSLPTGCPIRKSADQGIFAPPRGLSQLVTSFVASESQGIPHAPFVHSVLSSWTPGSPGVLFVFALPFLPFGLSSPPVGASVLPHGARCVLLYEFLSSRSWSALRSLRSVPLPTASSLVIVLFPK